MPSRCRTIPIRPTILLVTDDPGTSPSAADDLLREGRYDCVSVTSPGRAIDILREHPIDVALLDLSDSPARNLDVARRLREESRDVPVVLITGTRNFDAAIEAMRIGVHDYLLKPLATSELYDAVERAVQWRREALAISDDVPALEEMIAETAARVRTVFEGDAVASLATLEVVLEHLHGRKPEALRHARRVASLAADLAREMGLGADATAAITRGALVHDIGKLALPDSVLLRPVPLSAAEFDLVRSHPVIARGIAETTAFLRSAAALIGTMHERYDGTGYPDRLTGPAIPIGARILAVADAFDAVVGATFDPDLIDIANAGLVGDSGSRFDPAVVAAWLQCVNTAVDRVRRHAEDERS